VFCVPSQNVSVDKIIKAFTSRLAHIVKMTNKPIREGYKMWAVVDYRYI